MADKIAKAKFIEAVINAELDITDTQLIEDLGVSRGTFYKYKKNYSDEILKQARERFANRIPKWYQALDRKCLEGDTYALKTAFTMVGLYSEKKDISIEGLTGILRECGYEEV